MVILWYDFGMKIALSIPDDLFAAAEALAKRLGVSRSRMYASALQDFVAKHKSKSVTERLNAVYASHDGSLDEALRQIQARSLEKNSW
jgi:metal-responsive CopG/Arc/MetJ family transcriptional regulator